MIRYGFLQCTLYVIFLLLPTVVIEVKMALRILAIHDHKISKKLAFLGY